jgi:hypothetical protein
VVYRQGTVWLTDDEFASLVEEMEAAAAARAARTPGDGRNRHIFSFVVVPDEPGATPDPAPVPDRG